MLSVVRLSARSTVLAGLVVVLFVPSAAAQQPARQWAVLIGVQKHEVKRYNNLEFTLNDVVALRKVLTERAGLGADDILQLADKDADGKENKERWPTLANLRRQVPAFLKKVGKGDRVLIYFSGHGVAWKDHTYLVPRDYRAADPSGTGLPISELRRALMDCPARVKFLILDCCHAGAGKAAEGTLSSEAIAKAATRGSNRAFAVLASCREDQGSYEWPQRKQGVFTWWLCRALEGAATSGDGQVTLDAVNTYVHERVSQTAEKILDQEQNPVRLGKVEGGPVLLALRPERPDSLCRRLAEHLDLEVRYRKLKKVGVLEFLQPLGKVEGLGSSNLPAWCAERVRLALKELAGTDYAVLDSKSMGKAAKGVGVEVVGNPMAMRRLGALARGLDGAVIGAVQRRGATLQVRCELVAIKDGSSLVAPSGMIPLSEHLLGDSGTSFDNRHRPAGSPFDDRVLEHVDEESTEGSPLQKEKFPFRVEVLSVQAREGETITAKTKPRCQEVGETDSRVRTSRRSEDARGAADRRTRGRNPRGPSDKQHEGSGCPGAAGRWHQQHRPEAPTDRRCQVVDSCRRGTDDDRGMVSPQLEEEERRFHREAVSDRRCGPIRCRTAEVRRGDRADHCGLLRGGIRRPTARGGRRAGGKTIAAQTVKFRARPPEPGWSTSVTLMNAS